MRMKFAFLGITALLSVAFCCPANAALLHNYNLNGSLTDSLGGPSLVAHGGVLGAADYSFGADQGLTLGGLNLVANGDYQIELGFSFDTPSGYRKIIDFSGLASDSGLYSLGSALNFYPVTTGPAGVFQSGQLVNLLLARTAAGVVTGSINGTQQFTFNDITSTTPLGRVKLPLAGSIISASATRRLFQPFRCLRHCRCSLQALQALASLVADAN
jgi:hypothetical protein